MAADHEDFYKRLRKRVQKWARSREGRQSEYADYILLAPDLFHLLLRLSLDKEVAVKEKAKLAVAIAYFLSPVDLLPEWLVGPIGYLDDVGLAVFVVHSILQDTDEAIVTRHWAGDQDLLVTVRTFMDKADRMLGSGLWGRLQKLVEPAGNQRRRSTRSTAPAATPSRSDAARATEREMGEPTEKKPAKAEGTNDGHKPTTGKTAKKTTKKATKKTAAKRSGAAKKKTGETPRKE